MSFVNLLPEDYVARQAQRRANLLCLVLFGAVMVGVLWAAYVSDRGLRKTREVHERVQQSYLEAGRLIEQMQQLEAIKGRMFKKAKSTAGLLERVPRSYLLAAITNALPDGGSLKELALNTKRSSGRVVIKKQSRFDKAAGKRLVQTEGVSRMDVAITVTGLAATDVEVARFIASMARCPLIEAVDLVYSQEKEFQEVLVREFQVVLHLKPDADVLSNPAEAGQSLARSNEGSRAGED